MKRGFSLLEVLLGICIGSLIIVGVLGIFLNTFNGCYNLKQRSEISYQLGAGLEYIVTELQDADLDTILFLDEVEIGVYSALRFSKYESDNVYWFYVNTEGQLIRGFQRPGYDWGRTTIAENVEYLHIEANFTTTGQLSFVQLLLSGITQTGNIELSTSVSPGFL